MSAIVENSPMLQKAGSPYDDITAPPTAGLTLRARWNTAVNNPTIVSERNKHCRDHSLRPYG